MTCALCSGAIQPGDEINYHHPVYRSRGGTEVEPTHEACHIAFHSSQNDFREWGREGGKQSALTRRWAFNLRGVKDDPLYDTARDFNRAYYAH
ncbi:MAG: hypothetical protein AB1631_10245 [Acidobacteriota bacterium]